MLLKKIILLSLEITNPNSSNSYPSVATFLSYFEPLRYQIGRKRYWCFHTLNESVTTRFNVLLPYPFTQLQHVTNKTRVSCGDEAKPSNRSKQWCFPTLVFQHNFHLQCSFNHSGVIIYFLSSINSNLISLLIYTNWKLSYRNFMYQFHVRVIGDCNFN